MKTRILTALLLLPLAVGAILFLPNGMFGYVILGLFVVAAWEWARLARLNELTAYGYVLVVALGNYGLWRLLHEQQSLLQPVLMATALWWLIATGWVLVYPKGLAAGSDRRLITSAVGLWALIPAAVSIVILQDRNPTNLLALFGLIWAADSGAYFAGRSMGKHKLAPRVSPGKTWEGLVGGLLASALVALVFGHWIFDYTGDVLWQYAGLAMLVVLISVVGDLTESMFKRHAGLKDSGNLFPGHGGMLDRADSVLAAAPCYLLGISCLSL